MYFHRRQHTAADRHRRGPGVPLAGVAVLVIAVLLSACGVIERASAPPPRTLELLASGGITPAEAGPHGTLLIETPEARAGYRGEAIAYRQESPVIDYFATARWAAPPAELLAAAAEDALATAGLFRSVARSPAAVAADYRLEMELLYLEQDYRDGEPGNARVALRARLTDAGGQVLGSRLLSASHPASTAGPEAAALAAGAASERLLTELVRFVHGVLPPPDGPGE